MPIRWQGPPLSADATIHRYMRPAEFEGLVGGSMSLARLDAYHDAVPGPSDPREARNPGALQHYFEAMASGTTNEASTLAHLRELETRLAHSVAVKCFTVAEPEQPRMWAEWANEPGAVRVSTTIGRLLVSLDNAVALAVGRVAYIDHAREWLRIEGDTVRIAFAKDRTEYGWQQEVRLAVDPGPLIEGPEIPTKRVLLGLRPLPWMTAVRLHPASEGRHFERVVRAVHRLPQPAPMVSASQLVLGQ
jgi:hypothetical protein